MKYRIDVETMTASAVKVASGQLRKNAKAGKFTVITHNGDPVATVTPFTVEELEAIIETLDEASPPSCHPVLSDALNSAMVKLWQVLNPERGPSSLAEPDPGNIQERFARLRGERVDRPR